MLFSLDPFQKVLGQVCIMIHCGSRGLGHQVATDSLVVMEKAMKRDNIFVNDRQLACARINSVEGEVSALSSNIGYLKVAYLVFFNPEHFRSELLEGHGCGCKFCMGKSVLHDILCKAGKVFSQDI